MQTQSVASQTDEDCSIDLRVLRRDSSMLSRAHTQLEKRPDSAAPARGISSVLSRVGDMSPHSSRATWEVTITQTA